MSAAPARLDIYGFLKQLNRARIEYVMRSIRDDALMVEVALPGELWEVEFLADGTIEIEKFKSDGETHGEEALAELFERYETTG